MPFVGANDEQDIEQNYQPLTADLLSPPKRILGQGFANMEMVRFCVYRSVEKLDTYRPACCRRVRSLHRNDTSSPKRPSRALGDWRE